MSSAAYPDVKILGIDKFLSQLENVGAVSAGVASIGEAANYALVWEWGQTNHGPVSPTGRTVRGTNPDGKRVWLSSQAPFGYIRVNEAGYWQIIQETMAEADLNKNTRREIKAELERLSLLAAKRFTQLLKDFHVPIDSGALQRSLVAVKPGDPLLKKVGDEYETFVLGEDE